MKNTPSEQERIYREWMRAQLNDSGVRRYTDNAIIAYCYALRTACHKMVPPITGNLFAICDAAEFKEIYKKLIVAPDYDQINRENGNGTFGVALRLYQVFLEEGIYSTAPEIEAAFYVQNTMRSGRNNYSEDRGKESNYQEVPMKPMQCIFYGAPGTGKSYKVSQILEKEYPDPIEREKHTKRMIFHPTYKYEDFVGSIKPLVSLDHPLDYIYSAGPFSALLKEAFNFPAEKFYLIIEEINRGDSPAIFGDLFQLLDRAENGKSRYVIQNVDVSAYFARDPGLKRLFNDGKIWLPANFNILATMNTADENIFVLDSAFKRRFTLEYVPIEFDHMPDAWKKEYDVFSGTQPLMAVFAGTALEDRAAFLYRNGKLNRNWPTFAKLVNYLIDIVNSQTVTENRPELARIAENKKLGPFFVSDEELQAPDKFINKVIFYLKQDVFTYSDHYMIDSFETIYLKYLEEHGDIFELLR
ncbi:MAG: AAA family ATPase [Lachnospiraceae bacterium]|nr:AAA family ATPase [Lachnospiraceae bacterium]